MSAVDTALQVVSWAVAENLRPGSGPLPSGDVAGAAELAVPSAAISGAIARLASVGAARLRLSGPPLGDATPPGLGAGLLAAAVGARANLPAAELVLRAAAVQETAPAWDLAARHAVAGPVLRSGELHESLTGLVRDASPLTALADHPSATGEYQVERLLADRLLNTPDGRELAVRIFAEPAATVEQASWRAGVIARRRYRNLDFVLDIYETGMTVFGAEHRRRLRRAWSLLGQHPEVEAARPLVDWWRALAEIERRDPREIRRRSLITNDYVQGVRAYRRVATLAAAEAAMRAVATS